MLGEAAEVFLRRSYSVWRRRLPEASMPNAAGQPPYCRCLLNQPPKAFTDPLCLQPGCARNPGRQSLFLSVTITINRSVTEKISQRGSTGYKAEPTLTLGIARGDYQTVFPINLVACKGNMHKSRASVHILATALHMIRMWISSLEVMSLVTHTSNFQRTGCGPRSLLCN